MISSSFWQKMGPGGGTPLTPSPQARPRLQNHRWIAQNEAIPQMVDFPLR